jgi:ATP/maltotriose-dependent transcriptional regulator MalT
VDGGWTANDYCTLIAAQLVIGAGAVKTHTLNIYRKLEVANRTQAIVRAQELGLLRA